MYGTGQRSRTPYSTAGPKTGRVTKKRNLNHTNKANLLPIKTRADFKKSIEENDSSIKHHSGVFKNKRVRPKRESVEVLRKQSPFQDSTNARSDMSILEPESSNKIAVDNNVERDNSNSGKSSLAPPSTFNSSNGSSDFSFKFRKEYGKNDDVFDRYAFNKRCH